MSILSSKNTINSILPQLEAAYRKSEKALIAELKEKILGQKIRFPLLEYLANKLAELIPAKEQPAITDQLVALDEVGSYVIAGMVLQLRLKKHFEESVKKAQEYIIAGDKWYVCDIVGERVIGHALLTQPLKTIPLLKKMAKHDNSWIVRCIGVATHYAIKKGLPGKDAEEVFKLLISLSDTTDFHTKKGIGWAAKTTAKYYPGIIKHYQKQLENDPEVRQWFKTKVRIGLGRANKYAR